MATTKAFVTAIIFAVVTLFIFSDVSARQLQAEPFSTKQTQSMKQSKVVVVNYGNPTAPYTEPSPPIAGYPAFPVPPESYYLHAAPSNY